MFPYEEVLRSLSSWYPRKFALVGICVFDHFMTSHRCSLTKNPTFPAPLLLRLYLFHFFPILHAYSSALHPIPAPPFSHDSWIPPMSRSRSHSRWVVFIPLRSSVSRSARQGRLIFSFLLGSMSRSSPSTTHAMRWI